MLQSAFKTAGRRFFDHRPAFFRPPTGYRPATTGYRPATTGYRPATAGYRPATAGYRPATDRLPPATDRLPPATDRLPPTTDRLPSATDRLSSATAGYRPATAGYLRLPPATNRLQTGYRRFKKKKKILFDAWGMPLVLSTNRVPDLATGRCRSCPKIFGTRATKWGLYVCLSIYIWTLNT